MMNYKKACKMILDGFNSDDLTFRSKKYNLNEKKILRNVLLIEKKIFSIYIKDKKCNLKRFPFQDINPNYSMDKRTAVTIAKLLLAEGWTPMNHVKQTIEKYKNTSEYVTFGNIY